jgi:hypothetical protein
MLCSEGRDRTYDWEIPDGLTVRCVTTPLTSEQSILIWYPASESNRETPPFERDRFANLRSWASIRVFIEWAVSNALTSSGFAIRRISCLPHPLYEHSIFKELLHIHYTTFFTTCKLLFETIFKTFCSFVLKV